jgi:Fic family protein
MLPFIPHSLPLRELDYGRLIGPVGRANLELARYDGLLQGLVNPEIMLSPITMQEAVLSSRIEGTQATLDEVLEHEAGATKTGAKAQDVHEILNYRAALLLARDHLKEGRTISLFLVRELHRVLLDSVRGRDKAPGQFRNDQNWIGRPGCRIEEATFMPPSPLILAEHLRAWEAYLEVRDIDPLIQAAIVHAQFELIHPFKDGNGRIGRLLIPLYLYQSGTLRQPMFYLSSYLERHRDVYYDRLQQISSQGDWDGWIEFFLRAVAVQAAANSTVVVNIYEFYNQLKRRIDGLTRSPYALRLLDAIFDRPLFQTSEFSQRTGIPKQTASPLLGKLKAEGVLQQLRPASGNRPEILVFPELLRLVEAQSNT